MKCPYENDIEQVNQTSYDYNESGQNTFYEHKLFEHRTFVDCLKENCGAWQDGKCNYRGE
jgi:hypothetical protein